MTPGTGSLQLNPAAIIQGSISGTKFNDLNGDGIFDGAEPGLVLWEIELWEDDGDGSFEPGTDDTLVETATTDGNGDYTFNVNPGTYFVREINQSGWTQTAPVSVFYGPLVVAEATPEYLDQDFGNGEVPTLTLVKDVIRNNGGTAPDTSWTLNAAGPTSISGSEGDATVREERPPKCKETCDGEDQRHRRDRPELRGEAARGRDR